MDISQVFTCECNNKNYVSRARLSQHKKTKGHLQWETLNELKFLKCELTKKDDIIVRLETEVRHLNQANSILMSRFIRSDGL